MNFEYNKYTDYNPIYEYSNIYPKKIVKEYTKNISYNETEFLDNSGNKMIGFKKIICLVDFVKFLIGKYKSEQLNILPSKDLDDSTSLYKKYIQSPNNYAYVDAFFYNLTNKLKSNGFVHGIDVYDNYVCIKNNVEINIAEDFEYVIDSNFFNEKLNKLFYFKNDSISSMFRKDNLKLKELNISDVEESIDTLNIEELEEIEEPKELKELDNSTNNDIEEITVEEYNDNNSSSEEEDNNSEISLTDDENDDENDEDDSSINNETNKDDNSDEYETTDDENTQSNDDENTQSNDDENSFDGTIEDEIDELILVIKEMPTQVVCIEKCENTFDSLLDNNNITIEELESAMFQIITILYTYQKVYKFTHNDLHTNNIMFIHTDEPFLYYKIMNQEYKIPTFGKIYKIIDFGRSIYTVNDKLICSDSFSVNGTAHTQYNFEPFYNPNKPILTPNYSFDLCRLACSMLDFIIDDLDDLDKFKTIPIYNLIISWIYDDYGKNVLYKKNGEERYPDFKLYRMIARIVNNHLPEKQFSHECFEKYKSKDSISKNMIMNIDELITEHI
jgi:hypothetical protein